MKKYGFLITFFGIFLNGLIGAPNSVITAEIMYMDNPDSVEIQGPKGQQIQPGYGTILPRGSTITTYDTTIELRLTVNGSVIILDAYTIFRIDSLQRSRPQGGARENLFTLLKGKLRFIAAKFTGAQYGVNTETAFAGVRGTDFYRMYDPESQKDWLCVTEGAVQFSPGRNQEGILVPGGSFVNLNTGFQLADPSEQWLTNNLTLNEVRSPLP